MYYSITMQNNHQQEFLWMFKYSLDQKLLVKKANAEISALAKKKKRKEKLYQTGKYEGFVALVNFSVICLFMYSFLRESAAQPALRSCAEITFAELNWSPLHIHILPSHHTCWQGQQHLLAGVEEDTVMQKGTAWVHGEGFSKIHHLVGWCSFFTYSLPMALARIDGHEFWGWLPTPQTLYVTWRAQAIGNTTQQQLVCNSKSMPFKSTGWNHWSPAPSCLILASAGLFLPQFHENQNAARWHKLSFLC